jgi:zinc transporter ZupT
LEDLEEEEYDSAVSWRFGTFFLVAFLILFLSAVLFPKKDDPVPCEECEIDKLIAKEGSDASDPETNKVCEEDCCIEEANDCNDSCNNEACDNDKVINERPTPINWAMVIGITLGDFLHNFTDGVFIGTAFTLCTYDIAISLS